MIHVQMYAYGERELRAVNLCLKRCMCIGAKCVVVCCSVLQCVAVCCSVLQCVAVYWCQVHTLLRESLSSALCTSSSSICCNTLQHTATHCNTLQHTTTHCNTLQHTATQCNILQHEDSADAFVSQTLHLYSRHWISLQQTATHSNTQQHTATHYNTLQHTATLQLTATRIFSRVAFQTLYLTATHCITL